MVKGELTTQEFSFWEEKGKNKGLFQGFDVQEKPNQAISVLLADDHPMVMTGFSIALQNLGIRVVGEANSPQEAIQKYTELKPSVVVLDIRFGEKLTGLDAARELLALDPSAKIIFLTQFDQDNLIKEAYRMGVLAFITKDCSPSDLVSAVSRAHDGELHFLPHIAERLANLSVRGEYTPLSKLDQREIEIFTLMAQGFTINEIAEKFNLSHKTISNASLTLKDKLGVHRPADIARLAIKYKLIEP